MIDFECVFFSGFDLIFQLFLELDESRFHSFIEKISTK